MNLDLWYIENVLTDFDNSGPLLKETSHPWAISEIQDGVKDGCLTMFLQYVVHPIKNETFFYNTVNLHARLMKSRSTLACLFGYSHDSY